MLTTLAGERLNTWIHTIDNDAGQPHLLSFVRGILADYDAVRAGLSLHHNSGPVEGNINRIQSPKITAVRDWLFTQSAAREAGATAERRTERLESRKDHT